MLKLAAIFILSPAFCFSHYVPWSVDFMGNRDYTLENSQGQCSHYVKSWDTYPGGVTGSIAVHREDDPAIETWTLGLKFDKVVAFNTFDGVPDKSKGDKITVTPMPWNRANPAGSLRLINFQITTDNGDIDIQLLSITFNRGEEINCADSSSRLEVQEETTTETLKQIAPLAPREECSSYISLWNLWPGGVTGAIVVHNESDPSIDTWSLNLKFNQELTFNTFDGVQDKREGNEIYVTPNFWNNVTEAGTKRVVNFLITSKHTDPEIKLLKMSLNGEDEINCVELVYVEEEQETTTVKEVETNEREAFIPLLEKGDCSTYISSWNSWPGGVIGSIVVHNESDPAIDTWALSLKFNQELSFDTFDGTLDKSTGSEFSMTPAPWNQVTEAGIKRVVNFKLTANTNGSEIVLLSVHLNGGDEIRCIKASNSVEEGEETTTFKTTEQDQRQGQVSLSEKDDCSSFISGWNSWPGGVTSSIVVHRESEPAIDTWALTLKFDREVTFNTFEAILDKSQGTEFSLTPVFWNSASPAGTFRAINFQITYENNDTDAKLLSVILNGGEETKCLELVRSEAIEQEQTTALTAIKNKRGVHVAWPKKVMGIYLLLADDAHKGFESGAEWEPHLYKYQQQGSNVLFFSFIHPQTMEVPLAFQKLAKSRGTNEEGAVPNGTVILFAIGGYTYSVKHSPWNWLTSKKAAEAMAEKVAEWPEKYNCDGIDLDLEDGAGNRKEAGPNMVHFIRKLRELVPNMIINQPTYGYPQIEAENDVLNESWDKEGNSQNIVDSIGLMVYEGTQSLNYVKNFVKEADKWEGFPIKVPVPNDSVLLGAKGSSSPAIFEALANATLSENYRGIMVWYSSVKNGLQYAPSWDASENKKAQEAFVNVMNKFRQ